MGWGLYMLVALFYTCDKFGLSAYMGGYVGVLVWIALLLGGFICL